MILLRHSSQKLIQFFRKLNLKFIRIIEELWKNIIQKIHKFLVYDVVPLNFFSFFENQTSTMMVKTGMQIFGRDDQKILMIIYKFVVLKISYSFMNHKTTLLNSV